MNSLQVVQLEDYCVGRFHSMASPCEILVDTQDAILARRLTSLAQVEAKRIETKFSRYRDDNIVYAINQSAGKKLKVDEETAHLLDYADQCYELSDGLFDITSGVLRKVWKFDGSDNIPSVDQVHRLLKNIGWNKVRWQSPNIVLPENMELDFGGIGKEYAVDRVSLLLKQEADVACLVNFGGDLAANRVRANGQAWIVGVEAVYDENASTWRSEPSREPVANSILELKQGAMATSGDARRYLIKNGHRYSHILNPKTGWPVENAPRSVTVLSETCTEAGILSTLAMLHGSQAEDFLRRQGVKFWCIRD